MGKRNEDDPAAVAADAAAQVGIPQSSHIRVLQTDNGSMTREAFCEYAKHFVSQLPGGYGKGGKMSYLFLDGHSSRWNLTALRYFEDNNVCVFVIPSHTSIWAQPNDGKSPIKKKEGGLKKKGKKKKKKEKKKKKKSGAPDSNSNSEL